MVFETKRQTDRWIDRTLTILRASRLESCERELAGLGGRGLFDQETTDTDAERLFGLSWMAEEEKEPKLHTIGEMRAQVLSRLPMEAALLSPEEHDLAMKLAFLGGELSLFDWNDLIPARGLIRRLWCRKDPERKNRIIMPKAICLGFILTLASDEIPKVHEIVEETVDTADNTLYLAGTMPAETVMRDLGWKLQGTIGADEPALYRRMLKTAFETTLDREGRLMLVHPGLADPRGFLTRTDRFPVGSDQETLEGIYNSLMEVEDPLYEKMTGLIQDVCRPETGAEDTVEDLFLLAKQDAPLREMREVLASRIICLPTEEMVSALRELHDTVPKWLSMGMSRVQ